MSEDGVLARLAGRTPAQRRRQRDLVDRPVRSALEFGAWIAFIETVVWFVALDASILVSLAFGALVGALAGFGRVLWARHAAKMNACSAEDGGGGAARRPGA